MIFRNVSLHVCSNVTLQQAQTRFECWGMRIKSVVFTIKSTLFSVSFDQFLEIFMCKTKVSIVESQVLFNDIDYTK